MMFGGGGTFPHIAQLATFNSETAPTIPQPTPRVKAFLDSLVPHELVGRLILGMNGE